MKRDELLKKLETTNPERVKIYLDVLNRILIQIMVGKFLAKEEVSNIIKFWQNQIKSEINLESSARNDFLMGTALGRIMANSSKIEDGEELRLENLTAMNVAAEIAKHSFDSEENFE